MRFVRAVAGERVVLHARHYTDDRVPVGGVGCAQARAERIAVCPISARETLVDNRYALGLASAEVAPQLDRDAERREVPFVDAVQLRRLRDLAVE